MAVELEERFYETNRAQLLRWVPWLHLFRAFRIALDPRKIVLGALAAFVLVQGDRLIDSTLPLDLESPSPVTHLRSEEWHWTGVVRPWANDDRGRSEVDYFPQIAARLSSALFPLATIVEPGARLFVRRNTWADVADAWTRLLFHLAVWSLFGGAMARIAAVQFAHREGITARSAVKFSAARFSSTIGAPLLPLLFIGGFWLIDVLLGLIGRIPWIGIEIAGALWFLPILIGIALAAMLLIIAAGWPLMIATISTEGTDAFDGLSRGYDYVLNRTWYALWLLLLTVLYGTIVVIFVSTIANEGVRLAYWGVASGMGNDEVNRLLPLSSPALLTNATMIKPSASGLFGGQAAAFWLRVLAWLLHGFQISFFWTAATIIYFLLRLSLDAKPLDQVFVPAAQAGSPGLPLVGIPAAEMREAERRTPEGAEGAGATGAS